MEASNSHTESESKELSELASQAIWSRVGASKERVQARPKW